MRVNGNDLPARVELDGVLYNDVGDLNSLNQFEITFSGQTTVPRLKRERKIQRVPVTYEMTFWHGLPSNHDRNRYRHHHLAALRRFLDGW